MAVVLAVAAVLLSAIVVAAALTAGAAAVVAICSPLLLLTMIALAAWLLRERIGTWAARTLVRVAGPAIVRSLPPRDVLGTLLDSVFGESVGHEEISSALLGGGGFDVRGHDIAVSRSTTVHMSLQRIDHDTCLTAMTWSYEFAGVRDSHRLVIFTTTSEDIFRLLPSRRRFPLFESWLVPSDDQLDEYVPGFRNRLAAGISYRDEDGFVHTAAPSTEQGEAVPLRDYEQFVRLPERLDRKELRIVSLDLYDLADPDHVVEAVERLTLRASTVGRFDQGFVTWSAPYPCYVDRVSYDVRDLSLAHEKIEYQLVVHTNGMLSLPLTLDWAHVPDEITVAVNAWMLPGHGVTLLWRLAHGTEPFDGAEQF